MNTRVLLAVSVASLVAVLVIPLIVVATRLGGGDAGGRDVSFDTADSDPDWSPDGRLIAFVSNRGAGGIYVVRPDGTGMRNLLRGAAADVDWSPDGRAVAFTGEHGIFAVDVSTGKTRRVLSGDDVSLPAWAPSGRLLALVKEERGVFATYHGPIEETAPAIYVVRPEGSGLRRLLTRYRRGVGAARPGSISAVSETGPAWSPDGRQIVFEAGERELVAVDLRRPGRGRTTVAEGANAAVSPDGRLVAYSCGGDLCVANADGSGERRVASGGGNPSWPPDSRRIVFERPLYGGSGWGSRPRALSIVDATGKHVIRLTYGPAS